MATSQPLSSSGPPATAAAAPAVGRARLLRVVAAASAAVLILALPWLLQAALGAKLLAPGTLPRTYEMLLGITCLAIAAVGLNIQVGYTGLLNFGYGAFVLIGAYTTGILMKKYGFSFPAALACSVVHGALWGLVFGGPTLRLNGDYFTIVTLGLGQLTELLARNWVALTRGSASYSGIPRPAFDLSGAATWFGAAQPQSFVLKYSILDKRLSWWVGAGVLLACIAITFRLKRSRLGRAWRALREDGLAAQACGINITYYRVVAFVISAAMGALAGGIEAGFRGQADFRSYGFLYSITILAYVVFGGMGTVLGPVLGAGLLYWLVESLRTSPMAMAAGLLPAGSGLAQWLKSVPYSADMRYIVYGVILIAMMRFRPQGLVAARSIERELHGGEGAGGADGQMLPAGEARPAAAPSPLFHLT